MKEIIKDSEPKKVRFGNAKTVAEMLDCSVQAIYNRVARGEIPHFKTGSNNSRLLFDLNEIETMIRSGRIEAFAVKEIKND